MKYAQGSSVSCPWSTSSKSLGRPKSMGADGKQGEASVYRKVTQGKFAGPGVYATNTHNAKPQMSGDVAWPNYSRVRRPLVR